LNLLLVTHALFWWLLGDTVLLMLPRDVRRHATDVKEIL